MDLKDDNEDMRINLRSNVYLHNQTFILDEHKDTKDGGREDGCVCEEEAVKQQ